MEKECRNCRFWEGKADATRNSYGDCRRYAPRAIVGTQGAAATKWPRTNPGDWCGEFEGKPEDWNPIVE